MITPILLYMVCNLPLLDMLGQRSVITSLSFMCMKFHIHGLILFILNHWYKRRCDTDSFSYYWPFTWESPTHPPIHPHPSTPTHPHPHNTPQHPPPNPPTPQQPHPTPPYPTPHTCDVINAFCVLCHNEGCVDSIRNPLSKTKLILSHQHDVIYIIISQNAMFECILFPFFML